MGRLDDSHLTRETTAVVAALDSTAAGHTSHFLVNSASSCLNFFLSANIERLETKVANKILIINDALMEANYLTE